MYRSMIRFSLDDELRGNELLDFRKHITGCTDCRELLAAEEALSQLLHGTRPLYQAPEVLHARVSGILSSEFIQCRRTWRTKSETTASVGDQMSVLGDHAMLPVDASILSIIAKAQDSTDPEATVSTVLLKAAQSWDGVNYDPYPAGQPELTILKFVIPARTTLPWHLHPVPNAGYVISGTLSVESEDGRHHVTLHAGDVLPEMVRTVHRGWTGDTPAELIVFYAGVKGMPTAVKRRG